MTRFLAIRAMAVMAAFAVAKLTSANAPTPAADRLEAVRTLHANGHATIAEVHTAATAAAVEAAAADAERLWEALPTTDSDGGLYELSDLITVPASDTAVGSLPPSYAEDLAGLLRAEAGALPLEAASLRAHMAAERLDAIRSLHRKEVATAAELTKAGAERKTAEQRRRDLARRRGALQQLADAISDSASYEPRPVTTQQIHQELDAAPPENRPAAFACLGSLLDARVAAAEAKADAEAAAGRVDRLRAINDRFRRPGELPNAEAASELAGLSSAAADRRVEVATAVLLFACHTPQEARSFDWSSLGDPVVTQTTFAGFVPPLLKTTDLRVGRTTRYRSRWDDLLTATPAHRTEGSRYGRKSDADGDGAYGLYRDYGRHTPAFIRFDDRPNLDAPRAFEPGWTYSSGYAFGQKRWDLPARYRYPRADAYGGPWYLPGSPTNRLRYQYPRYDFTTRPPRD